ncbi:MAG: AAA family ATPase, partial [Gammaproteobacteria bacterium]
MFIGRESELESLNQLLRKRVASFVVIRGRRRIGKSRLIKEFSKNHRHYIFSGLPPTPETTIESQLKEFSKQMARLFKIPFLPFTDWGDAFWFLADKLQGERVILVLDEISWLGSLDPDFLGKLKNAWDLHFKNNPELILILCGSVSSWIDQNILKNTGFVGRISLNMCIEPLPIKACNAFWRSQGKRLSAYEKLKILSVTGCIPRYLEEIIPEDTAENNIKNLCFIPEGLLFNEFAQIFFDAFLKKTKIYQDIMLCLINGPLESIEISHKIGYSHNSHFSEYLKELALAGFVSRDYTFNFKKNKPSKLSRYRIKDNYMRFYLKYIYPNRALIEQGLYKNKDLSTLPQWYSLLGYQFENLVLSNRSEIWKSLNLSPNDILIENPY